jgi:CcmD family protein
MFYLMMGFGSVWLLVTLYLVYLGLRQRRLKQKCRRCVRVEPSSTSSIDANR